MSVGRFSSLVRIVRTTVDGRFYDTGAVYSTADQRTDHVMAFVRRWTLRWSRWRHAAWAPHLNAIARPVL